MTAFDTAWRIMKELVSCPMCGEEGPGSWFNAHYPECAQRYIEENAEGFDIVENPDAGIASLFDALEIPDNLREYIGERHGLRDYTNQFIAKPQFGGISDEMSEKLDNAMERAMISSMYQSGVLGRHPDQSVVEDDTTRRVGLHFDSDQGLYEMRRDWVKDRFDTSDLDQVGFGQQMAELLEGSTIHQELIDNERTWDDVNWHSIIDDEHQAQIEDFYRGLATGEYHLDDETFETDDWLHREQYIDDAEHMKRLADAQRHEQRMEELRRKRREQQDSQD